MKIFKINIGCEFENQMKNWFNEHPEISHKWYENKLIISHPSDKKKECVFIYNSNSLFIENHFKKAKFNRKLFTSIFEQVFRIRGFWINGFYKRQELAIKKPHLKDNECVVMVCNRRYGQVLTVGKNIFTGWGEVYKIFDTIEEAENYCNNQDKDIFEFYIYNSTYHLVKEL